ncbi:hypothetical protein CR205_14325 [Alteribacter lacisalsi]|uniref:BCE-2095-like N-terminal domain-containing protein n=1 Tax=Alteribacter lacisalsi TaxID=2045244 RepID=A0A2W0H787_9BACI|nr:hypothetical protein [Alteribacter lacisalsi]PYZ96851.1 hypothetical protein CR205_14325 [Alteribacter lacisalsi]
MKSQIQNRFVDWRRQAFETFWSGDLEKSWEIHSKIESLFPEKRHITDMWKICLFGRSGQNDEAFRMAFASLHDGIWWHPDRLREEPELDPLKKDARFDLFVDACRNRYRQEADRHPPLLCSMGNPLSVKRMFAIHWRGDNADSFSEYWEETAFLSDWHVGFPQSSQVFGSDRFCWDDEKKAEADLVESKRHFDQISAADPDQTILCGASQGGKLAIDYTLRMKPFSESRFFAIVPSILDLAPYEAKLREGVCPQTRGYILTGDRDPFVQKASALHELLRDYDIPCKLTIVKGLGHDFPKGFEMYLKDVADFLHQA